MDIINGRLENIHDAVTKIDSDQLDKYNELISHIDSVEESLMSHINSVEESLLAQIKSIEER